MDKRTSLLRKFVIYGQKRFITSSPGGAGVLRILNSDGTLSSLPPMQNQTIRVVNTDGSMSTLHDSVGQNIRFVTADGSVVIF
jgi:hypothetical protein